mgnify:CR=1 FL=1
MNNLHIIKENDIVYGERMVDKIQEFDNLNKLSLVMQSDLQYNIRQLDRDLRHLENVNNRYLNAQYEYSNIVNNEYIKYRNNDIIS